MRSSPPMPDEIKAGFYPDFEHSWRKAELAGRAVMLLAVCATLAGLLGGGPVSIWTRHAKAGAREVEHAPVVRFGTPTGLTLLATPTPGQDRVAVTLPASIVEKYGLQTVFPQPVGWGAGEAGIRMVFAVPHSASAAMIQVGGMPLYDEGRWSEDHMRKLRMQEADIRNAIIERDGTISILPKEKQ